MYHGLCYTSYETLAITNTMSVDPPEEIDPLTNPTKNGRFTIKLNPDNNLSFSLLFGL